MMLLREKLKFDMNTAKKEAFRTTGEAKTLATFKADTLSWVMAQILKAQKDQYKNQELTDEQVVQVLMKEVTTREKTINDFEPKIGSANDEMKQKLFALVDTNRREISVLREYLPKQMTEDEIRDLALKVKVQIGAGPKDIGAMMKAMTAETKGKANGQLVNKIVKEVLN